MPVTIEAVTLVGQKFPSSNKQKRNLNIFGEYEAPNPMKSASDKSRTSERAAKYWCVRNITSCHQLIRAPKQRRRDNSCTKHAVIQTPTRSAGASNTMVRQTPVGAAGAPNTAVRQTPLMSHCEPARATSAPAKAGCAPIFNGCTKDSARQLDFRAPTDSTAHKKPHAHYFQWNFVVFIFIIFIKTFWCGATYCHPAHHNTHEAPNTWHHLDTRPQQARGGLWRQHVYAAEPRAAKGYTPDYHMRQQQAIANDHIDDSDRHARSLHRQPSNAIFKYHHHHHQQNTEAALRKVLPSGPPPFRPSTIVLGLNSIGVLEKLKGTKIFKKMYRSKAYYLFLDVLEQLASMVDKIAQKKIELAETQIATVQAVAHKFLVKGGQLLKLKWPLVMLNPHFIKEILSNPTLLVMLFHAIEVAYLSMPATFWLKPLVKLVKQPTPEKEEETWWRRKRIYEVLNGPGSSELQPNLKTKHFRQPGNSGAPAISLAGFAQAIRQLTGKPEPDPSYYSYPSGYTRPPPALIAHHHTTRPLETFEHSIPLYQGATDLPDRPNSLTHGNDLTGGTYQGQNLNHHQKYHDGYMSSQQAKAFLANQRPTHQHVQQPYGQQEESSVESASDHVKAPLGSESVAGDTTMGQLLEHYGSQEGGVPTPPDGNHLNSFDMSKLLGATHNADQAEHGMPSRHSASAQLMSPTDFAMLDPRERELILEETRKSHLEARLADELIKQQSEFVDSIVHRHDAIERRQHGPTRAVPPTQVHGHEEERSMRIQSPGHLKGHSMAVGNDMISFMTKRRHDSHRPKSNI